MGYTFAVFPPAAVIGEGMKLARGVSTFLLFFLSIGAFVGSVPMLVDPRGDRFGFVPVSLLQYSPFRSYFIPGLILLTANGLLPLLVLWRKRRRLAHYGVWVALQGCVLFGFILVECRMLRMVIWPHYLYAAIGIALVVCGFILRREPAIAIADMRPGRRSA